MQQVIAGRLMQRYAAAGTTEDLEHCERLINLAPDEASRELLIVGLNKAFQARTLPPLPGDLEQALRAYQAARGDSGVVLAVRQGSTEALPAALKLLQQGSTDSGLQIEIVKAFGEVKYTAAQNTMLKLAIGQSTSEPALQRVALQAITIFDDPQIARSIASSFDNRIPAEHSLRETACRSLASRESWALTILNEVNSWRLKPNDIPADVVQRLRTFANPDIVSAVERAFGKAADISSPEKVAQIESLTGLLQDGGGNPQAGALQFRERCATCHRLFGEGQQIAPALDNYDRGNLKFWLPSIVAPSIEIREGYQSYLALTDDDRVLTGMIAAEDLRTITLRTADNQLVSLPKEELVELRALPTSLMPEDTLKDMSDQQLLDLFAYLMSNREAPSVAQ